MGENQDSNFIISENRIDIIIGIEYVKAYDRKYKTDFFKRLYISNKRSFNRLREKDWNHGWENPKQKRGKFAFLESFNRLIDSIKELKTNSEAVPVYLGDKSEPWVSDGMHRASACYGLNLPVNAEFHNKPIEQHSRWYYPATIDFFKNGVRGPGMRDVYCNFTMEMFFRKYECNFKCLIFWPRISDYQLSDDLKSLFENDIIYDHSIKLDTLELDEYDKLGVNITRLFYENHGFFHKKMIRRKSRECFNRKGTRLRIVFIRNKTEEQITEIKLKLREHYGKGYNTIHATDTLEEARYRVIQLLNQNTINFLTQVDIKNYFRYQFHSKFLELRKFCEENKINKSKICIVGKFVDSLYTKTDCEQIEILVHDSCASSFENSPFKVSKEKILNEGNAMESDDVIYNPENYFYYYDYKCCLYKFTNFFTK